MGSDHDLDGGECAAADDDDQIHRSVSGGLVAAQLYPAWGPRSCFDNAGAYYYLLCHRLLRNIVLLVLQTARYNQYDHRNPRGRYQHYPEKGKPRLFYRRKCIDHEKKHCPPELEEWYTNPLEFLHPNLYICHVFWRYFNQILRRIHCPIFSRPVSTKPYNRIPSDDFPHLDTLADALACPIVLLFGSMFMIAWRFDFPSSLERILWRIASCYTLLFSIFGGPYIQFCYKVLLPRHAEKRRAGDVEATIPQTRMQHLAAKMRNIHTSRDPRLEIPLLALIPVTVLCALYCISRAYILVEDLVGLRDLPESAFQTVEWSVYIPHW